jgi:hypothetical protein
MMETPEAIQHRVLDAAREKLATLVAGAFPTRAELSGEEAGETIKSLDGK